MGRESLFMIVVPHSSSVGDANNSENYQGYCNCKEDCSHWCSKWNHTVWKVVDGNITASITWHKLTTWWWSTGGDTNCAGKKSIRPRGIIIPFTHSSPLHPDSCQYLQEVQEWDRSLKMYNWNWTATLQMHWNFFVLQPSAVVDTEHWLCPVKSSCLGTLQPVHLNHRKPAISAFEILLH